MQVEIWSDVICPWCHIGKRRFEAALARFAHRERISVITRSFELDPNAPRQYPGTLNEMLSDKYGVSPQQAAAMNARVTALAREIGLKYRLALARPGNTFDAHRLLHHAMAHHPEQDAAERIMRGYFCEGLPVGDRASLARLAPEFGIAENEARALLETNNYADAVRADEARAAEIGISGVPFFVFAGKLSLSGAQTVEVFSEALYTAWTQTPPEDTIQ